VEKQSRQREQEAWHPRLVEEKQSRQREQVAQTRQRIVGMERQEEWQRIQRIYRILQTAS
jgi:bisphosphoglycerate-independent phosphoglycerate mutase (AlkP superfamily)